MFKHSVVLLVVLLKSAVVHKKYRLFIFKHSVVFGCKQKKEPSTWDIGSALLFG